MQEAEDFRAECDALAAILDNRAEGELKTVTLFKGWTVEDVIGHLHLWNKAAAMTLRSRDAFGAFLEFALARLMAGETHPTMQRAWFDQKEDGLSGAALYAAWRDFYPTLADAYAGANPETRVAWAGPDMTTRSKIIARQMESWAHGQEIFDVFGLEREETDRIRNIAHLGVTTYSWAFRNRGEEPPQPKPFVKLTAPSGAVWTWNDEQVGNAVAGKASDFCQVVTQTRSIEDTSLALTGNTAERWMAIAQCFAGAPNDPPKKGERYKAITE